MVYGHGCRVSYEDRTYSLVAAITTVDKLLDFRGEPKTCPRNSEDAQGEKQ